MPTHFRAFAHERLLLFSTTVCRPVQSMSSAVSISEGPPGVWGTMGTREQKENNAGNMGTKAVFREHGTPKSKKYFQGTSRTREHKKKFVGKKDEVNEYSLGELLQSLVH